MFYCILVIISALCYAVQFAANKAYQAKKGSAARTSLKFIAIKGAVAAIVFFFVAWGIYKRPITPSPMSIILAVLASVFGCACWILGFVIFKYGSLSVFSTFLMIGGMAVPFLYSAARGEKLGALATVGICLLVASLIFPLLGQKNEKRQGGRAVFVLLCLLVFLFNGGMSVVSSIHSGSDFLWFTENTVAKLIPSISTERVEGVEFTVLVNASNAILCSLALAVLRIVEKRRGISEDIGVSEDTAKIDGGVDEIATLEADSGKAKRSRFSESRAYTAMLIAVCAILDASAFLLMRIVDGSGEIVSVKYPLQTACTVVLTAVVGYIVFREKPSKLSLVGLIVTFLSTFLLVL